MPARRVSVSAWSAYGGLVYAVALDNGFTLEPSLDVGLARLTNSETYTGVGR